MWNSLRRRNTSGEAWPTTTSRSLLTVALVAIGCGAVAVPSVAAQEAGRLKVHPMEMASGTETALAGVQKLDSLYPKDSLLEGAVVYVPKRCVGKSRCAFGVLLHGGSSTGWNAITGDDRLFQIFADSLGMILLAPSSHSDDRGWGDQHLADNPDVPRLDAAMLKVLQNYAIDPKRVVLIGGSAGSGAALDWGYVNGDIFTRVICFEAWAPFAGEHEFDGLTPHGKPQYYLGMSREEGASLDMPTFVPQMRAKGYSVTYNEDDGTHAMTMERGSGGFGWLVKTEGWH